MADNITLNSGSGGATVKTDEDGSGNHWQYMKLAFGADNTQTRVTAAAPLPVEIFDVSGTLVADIGAIKTAVQLIDNAISGSEMQVDIVAALPAGTNAIGKLAANSGVDIGDVDVTSIIPGTGATNLGKAEDAAHTTGDVGVMALTVRQDVAAALGGTDADYQPLITDSSGRLHVNVGNTVTVGSHAVTNAGTFAVQEDGAALTALQLIDDAVYTDGSGTPSKGIAVMGTDGTNPQLISVDSSGNVQVDLVTANVTNAGTFAVQVDGTALTRLTDIETNTDYGAVTGGGTETGALRVTIANNSTGVLSVDDNSGSLTVDASQLDIDDLAPTADGVSAALDTSQIMNGLTALTPKFAAIDAATSGDNTIVAGVTDKKIRVLSLFLVSAGTVNARFESGASGTALTGQMNLVANSGFTLPFNPAGWFETAASALLNLELSGAISVDGCLTYVEV